MTSKGKSQPAKKLVKQFCRVGLKVKYLSVLSVAMLQMKGSVLEEKTGRGSTPGAVVSENGRHPKVAAQ